MRIALRSKIHRAWVTGAEPDYIGSVIIDEALMERVDLWEYEKVLICDVTNGNRWETYVLPGGVRLRRRIGAGRRGEAVQRGRLPDNPVFRGNGRPHRPTDDSR